MKGVPATRLVGLLSLALAVGLGWQGVAADDPMPLIGAAVGGRTGPDGTVLDCDLPGSLHMRNTGGMGRKGPGSGAGLCVWTSGQVAARWENLPQIEGLQKWMTSKPGGGDPDKLDRLIAQFCKEKGVPVPAYVQFRPGSATQDVCKAILASGRMLCHTYQLSPTRRYGGQWVEHMVNSAAGSRGQWAVLDNNYPGDSNYEWCSPSEWWSAVTGGGKRKLWAWCWLAPPPPPPPRN